jgi:hypothetical protein
MRFGRADVTVPTPALSHHPVLVRWCCWSLQRVDTDLPILAVDVGNNFD